MRAGVLGTIRALGAAGAFRCYGDAILAMGGLCLSADDVNATLASAARCEACPAGVRVFSTDPFGESLVIEVCLHPPSVISLGRP